MSRRRRAQQRVVAADPVYLSLRVAKFVNYLMWDGEKPVAQGIVYELLTNLANRTSISEVDAFESVIEAVTPAMEVKPRRIGGATYQVPVAVSPRRGFKLSCEWLIRAARKRKGKTMQKRLLDEFLDALSGRGEAFKSKQNKEGMAESNKAFAHFKWN